MKGPNTPRRTRVTRYWTLIAGGMLLWPVADARAQPESEAPPAEEPAPAVAGAPTATAFPLDEGAERVVVSIDEAVRRALTHNPSIAEATAAIRRAEASVAEARSFLLPRIDGTARFTVQGPIPTFTFVTPPQAPGEDPVTQRIRFGRPFTRNFAVVGTYELDAFGRFRDARRAAERGVNVAEGGLYTTQNELAYAVQNVYLAALRSRELIGVARESLELSQEQFRVADAQFRAGVAPEFDRLRASVQVSNVRQNLVNAEATYRRTLANLAELLGLEPEELPELVPVALPPEPDEVAAATARRVVDGVGAPAEEALRSEVPASLAAALAEAFTHRPEIYSAEWARRAAEAQVAFQSKGNRPTLNLTASFFYDPDVQGLAVVRESWSLVANIAIPIWDAGLTRARTRQARADVESAEAQLEATRNGIMEEVRRALIDLEDAAERRRAAAANTEEAREALRIGRIRYTAGLAPNVEVTDAEVALTQARTNEVNAAYDYLAALANLNRSLGRYADETLATLLK